MSLGTPSPPKKEDRKKDDSSSDDDDDNTVAAVETPDITYGDIRVIHAGSDAPMVNVTADGANLLTDVDYAERADFAFGAYRYFVGEPRSVYLTIQYRQDN